MDDPLLKPALAEGIGTFALTFVAVGASVWAENDLGSGLIGIALANGLIVMAMVAVFGGVSGAHINPAVTLGMWLNGKVDATRAGVYVIAQFAGAILAAVLLSWFIPAAVADAARLGTPGVGHIFGTGAAQAVAVEAILTFFLVLTIFAVATDATNPYASFAPIAIGGVLAACILGGGPISGAALNPARWFGPALVSGTFIDWWVWVIGPLAGAVAAAMVWGIVLAPRKVGSR